MEDLFLTLLFLVFGVLFILAAYFKNPFMLRITKLRARRKNMSDKSAVRILYISGVIAIFAGGYIYFT